MDMLHNNLNHVVEGGGGALPYEFIRDVPFLRVSFFSETGTNFQPKFLK